MEDNANLTEEQSDEFSAETLSAAKIFERLTPEAKTAMLELLRQLNGIK